MSERNVIETAILLDPGQDLNEYVFMDLDHADEWLHQGFAATDTEYRARIRIQVGEVWTGKCKECGHHARHFKPYAGRLTVDEFFQLMAKRAIDRTRTSESGATGGGK